MVFIITELLTVFLHKLFNVIDFLKGCLYVYIYIHTVILMHVFASDFFQGMMKGATN